MKQGHSRHVSGLSRLTALLATVGSSVIGPDGGEIHLPHAGLKVIIPQGAFAETSTVSVHAHTHLLGFTVDVSPTQPLATRARIEQHVGPSDHATGEPPFLLGCTEEIQSSSECSELFAGRLDGETVIAHIPHFSGYILAGGINSGQSCNPDTDGPECIWVDDE